MSADGAREAETAAGPDERGTTPAEAIERARVRAPTRGNRRLEALLDGVNADPELRGWWHMAQVTSERLGMSDHSWVHVQIVLNIALRLLRLLAKAGVEPAMVTDHGMGRRDAEVVVAAGALLHDVGMSIHRADHEAYSLFLAEPKLRQLLDGVYEEPERTVVVSEALQRDHRPPAPRRAVHARGGGGAGRRRARHGPGALPGAGRVGAARHPRPVRRRDRRGGDRGGRRTARSGSRSR